MAEYPLKEKIKEVLADNDKRLPWLLGELDKSESWWFKLQSIDDLQFKTILKISDVLEFDFIVDYYKWAERSLSAGGYLVNEPQIEYDEETGMTVQFKWTGNDAQVNMLKIMKQMLKPVTK